MHLWGVKMILTIASWLFFSGLFAQAGNATDSDKDGLADAEEIEMGTNPNKADTDGDGTNDVSELFARTNPTDPSEKVLKVEVIGPILNPKGTRIVTSKNGVTTEDIFSGNSYPSSSTLAVEKHRLISKNRLNLQKQAGAKAIETQRLKDARKKAGDDRLNQMELECKRLNEERTKNPSQVNDAKYWQAYSNMINLRLQLYPDSVVGDGGTSSRLEDIERKVDKLQDTVDKQDH